MSIVEKAKLDIESAHISDIIGARRIAAKDEHTQENMNRAIDSIMKTPPRLKMDKPGMVLKSKRMQTKERCPSCGHDEVPQQSQAPPTPTPVSQPGPSAMQAPNQPQGDFPQQQQMNLDRLSQSLSDQDAEQLLELLKKRFESRLNPVDQPQSITGQVARPF